MFTKQSKQDFLQDMRCRNLNMTPRDFGLNNWTNWKGHQQTQGKLHVMRVWEGTVWILKVLSFRGRLLEFRRQV